MEKKYKVLVLSDHALSTSGVGCQTRFLLEGLIKKGRWSFRQFGAAIKHANYEPVEVNPDFIIKPIDGFGNRNLIMQAIVAEKPDALFIFTDPRFFTWLYEMEDEVRSVCPIVYWHVWDNYPFPEYNRPIYESTDLINCHSHLTYTMVGEHFPKKTNFIPHSLPEDLFYPLPDDEIMAYKKEILGDDAADKFVLFWVNRNARRKRPNDVLLSFKMFLDRLEKEGKDRSSAILLMHTDPTDNEGPNLLETAKLLDLKENIVFSNQRVDFDKMNVLHNISDACINLSYAEGFGLATLEAMNCAKPIIATKTGGLTRQVVDHRDNSENGFGLDVKTKTLVGSQSVPYIYEDYADNGDAAKAIYDLYTMKKEERIKLGQKARQYALSEFSYQKTIDEWDKTMLKTIKDYKHSPRKTWEVKEITS
jgi:glycosyltransferase involved in cell wall biosynthesis